jgi:hypothetical protein
MRKFREGRFYREIGQLFNAGFEPQPDISRLSKVMYNNGATPYIYVRIALRHLTQGNYSEANRMLHFAEKFTSVFFSADSAEEREFTVEMFIIREMLLFLTEKFKDLPCDSNSVFLEKDWL